jgi:hypothetical protein
MPRVVAFVCTISRVFRSTAPCSMAPTKQSSVDGSSRACCLRRRRRGSDVPRTQEPAIVTAAEPIRRVPPVHHLRAWRAVNGAIPAGAGLPRAHRGRQVPERRRVLWEIELGAAPAEAERRAVVGARRVLGGNKRAEPDARRLLGVPDLRRPLAPRPTPHPAVATRRRRRQPLLCSLRPCGRHWSLCWRRQQALRRCGANLRHCRV